MTTETTEVEDKVAVEPTVDRHGRHQAMLERHKLNKVERKEDHALPNRTRKFPANSLL